jgi:hypothetical protein
MKTLRKHLHNCNKITRIVATFFIYLSFPILQVAEASSTTAFRLLDSYDVVWESPSEDEHGSMPIGNGDLAANVWVEPSGDLVFYISKSDAWSGNGRLLKLGRVRVKCEPALFSEGMKFKQELDLESGTIKIRSGDTKVEFWIDANNPVIHVDIRSDKEFTATAALKVWRTEKRELKGKERYSARALRASFVGKNGRASIHVEPDDISVAINDAVCWFHRNRKSCYAVTLENQHLGHLLEKYPDPLMDLTFGALMTAESMQRVGDKTLKTKSPVHALNLQLSALTEQTETEEAWIEKMKAQKQAQSSDLEALKEAHVAWWKNFWDRSWIFITGNNEEEDSIADKTTRAYVLQRWMNACAGRGQSPIKFNGSLFTVAADDEGQWYADYRCWGGNYWWQNTRLPYWSMLHSGDFDMMRPLWKQYTEILPLLKDRVKAYYNHEGAYFSETMYLWGTAGNTDFGWDNPGVEPTNPFVKRYWQSGIELVMMMLDYYAHTEDDAFVKKNIVPVGDAVVTFYEQHYHRRDANGKMVIYPAQSLESWQDSMNPSPVIVGLNTVLDRLLELPLTLTSDVQRQAWARLKKVLPPLPIRTTADGKRYLAGEERRVTGDRENLESPELYSVFPYRHYTYYNPDADIGLTSYAKRELKHTGGWVQDAVQAAILGLTSEAKKFVVTNALNKNPVGSKGFDKGEDESSRFPAFWGPNYDWIPDQDHGSITMIALQRMLMQADKGKIYLLSAWPKEWNASFKMHAPQNTTVQGRIEDGKVLDLKVVPESRRKDVEIVEDDQQLILDFNE